MKMYICSVFAQHKNTQEYRSLIEVVIAASEEEALLKATLLAHPGQGGVEPWQVLKKQAEEVDRELIERAAREVLGWTPPENRV